MSTLRPLQWPDLRTRFKVIKHKKPSLNMGLRRDKSEENLMNRLF